MLTKPPSSKSSLSHHPPSIIPVIAMMNPSSSSSNPPNNPASSLLFDMDYNLPIEQLPPYYNKHLHIQAYLLFLKYQTRILRRYGDTSILNTPSYIHSSFPLNIGSPFQKKLFVSCGIFATFITLPFSFLSMNS